MFCERFLNRETSYGGPPVQKLRIQGSDVLLSSLRPHKAVEWHTCLLFELLGSYVLPLSSNVYTFFSGITQQPRQGPPAADPNPGNFQKVDPPTMDSSTPMM